MSTALFTINKKSCFNCLSLHPVVMGIGSYHGPVWGSALYALGVCPCHCCYDLDGHIPSSFTAPGTGQGWPWAAQSSGLTSEVLPQSRAGSGLSWPTVAHSAWPLCIWNKGRRGSQTVWEHRQLRWQLQEYRKASLVSDKPFCWL